MKHAIGLAAFALLAGCADGTALPVGSAQEMPTLQVDAWGKANRGGDLRIGALNGKALAGRDETRTYLSPGPQDLALDVLLCPGKRVQCQSIATVKVHFEAQPRRAYRARVDEQGEGSMVFRAWVVDDTGAIVAPAKP